MHYYWQVLVLADSRTEAIRKAETVMEGLGGDGKVWDYYTISQKIWARGPNGKEHGNCPGIVNAAKDSYEFHERLNATLRAQLGELEECRESLRKQLERHDLTLEQLVYGHVPADVDTMIFYYHMRISKYLYHEYQSASYFASDGDIWHGPELTEETLERIMDNPKRYWLVSADLHN